MGGAAGRKPRKRQRRPGSVPPAAITGWHRKAESTAAKLEVPHWAEKCSPGRPSSCPEVDELRAGLHADQALPEGSAWRHAASDHSRRYTRTRLDPYLPVARIRTAPPALASAARHNISTSLYRQSFWRLLQQGPASVVRSTSAWQAAWTIANSTHGFLWRERSGAAAPVGGVIHKPSNCRAARRSWRGRGAQARRAGAVNASTEPGWSQAPTLA